MAEYIINQLPTEGVAPVKQGKWIKEIPKDTYCCSNCGMGDIKEEDADRFSYCPGCASEMSFV